MIVSRLDCTCVIVVTCSAPCPCVQQIAGPVLFLQYFTGGHAKFLFLSFSTDTSLMQKNQKNSGPTINPKDLLCVCVC